MSQNEVTEYETLRAQILQTFNSVYARQHEDQTPPEIADDTVLLESGLDSLGFAILVTCLEDELGYDPFSISTVAYYPRTFQDFVKFYDENRP